MSEKVYTIFFSHSAGPQYSEGKGSYDLVKYLKYKLSNDFKFLSPKIKKPNTPSYDKYKQMYESSFTKINGPIILIGHSLGGSTLLKYLSEEKPNITIDALFLISTPHWKSNMKEFQLKENFESNLVDIRAIFLYHSTDDLDVPIDSLKFYKKAFKRATVNELPGREHLFSKGLPKLIADLKGIVTIKN